MLKITGVYKDDEMGTYYLLQEDIYAKILEDYSKSYIYDRSILYIQPSDYKDVMKYLSDNNAIISEPSINEIYEFEYLMQQLKKPIIFLLVILIIIAVFMVYYNINASISNNKKSIGVLRSMGVTKRCTIKMFLVEAVMICTISCAVSTTLSGMVVSVVNKTVRNGIKLNPYDLLWFDIPISVITILITFLLFLFAAIVPILKYSKKTPIEIIRN